MDNLNCSNSIEGIASCCIVSHPKYATMILVVRFNALLCAFMCSAFSLEFACVGESIQCVLYYKSV